MYDYVDTFISIFRRKLSPRWAAFKKLRNNTSSRSGCRQFAPKKNYTMHITAWKKCQHCGLFFIQKFVPIIKRIGRKIMAYGCIYVMLAIQTDYLSVKKLFVITGMFFNLYHQSGKRYEDTSNSTFHWVVYAGFSQHLLYIRKFVSQFSGHKLDSSFLMRLQTVSWWPLTGFSLPSLPHPVEEYVTFRRSAFPGKILFFTWWMAYWEITLFRRS